MTAILLILNIIAGVVQQIARKEADKRNQCGVYSFSAAAAFVVLISFLLTHKGQWNISGQMICYSFVFALSYAVTTITTMLAIQSGPLSLTTLAVSYSLVIPTLYGMLFLREPITLRLILGIMLLFISIFLINLEGKEDKKITVRWLIFAGITFLGNGLCATTQKVYQVNSGGSAESEFMILSISVVVGILAVATILCERKDCISNLKKGALWYGICGIGNAASNYLTMLLALSMPASVLYPLASSGGIVLTALCSIIFYHEKLSIHQKIGLVLGVAATVALS